MIDIRDIDFIENFKCNITNHKKDELKKMLSSSGFKDQVKLNGMDLLVIICDNIEEDMVDFNNRDDIYCNLINFIAEYGNPKEIICIFNSHLDGVKLDFKFLILLYPLSIALQRLDVTLTASKVIIKESLTCAISYFKNLPIAHYKGLEGEELEVYIQASETQRFLRLSKTYLSFLESIIRNEKIIQCKTGVKLDLFRNILDLYYFSLINLVFYFPGIVAEECRSCSLSAFQLAEQLVGCLHETILDICNNNSKLQWQIANCQDQETKEQLRTEIVPYSSLVCLLYHVFVWQHFKKFPQVYLPVYNLKYSTLIISNCLRDSLDPHTVRLCLLILEEFNNRIDFPNIKWDRCAYLPLFESLKVASISNFNHEIRGLAYNIFVKLFNKFEEKGRFKLLKKLLKETDHFGFKGQLILLLKKEIVQVLSQKKSQMNKYFLGSSVYPLISDIYTLPDSDKSDVVNESEWILAALNMLYVILNRDKQHLIGMDVLINDIQKDFLQPLTKASEMSLTHYNNEKRLIETDNCSSTVSELNIDLGFMNKGQKVDFIDKAILMIELVRCNISRVTNII